MAQPQWITPSGSLGVIPEGAFYRAPVQAVAEGDDVYFQLIAGELPSGIQITPDGIVEGTPKNTLVVQGVPTDVSRDVTSQFAIRAYTRRTVNGNLVVNRLADRTFTLTVTGQDVPDFITPAGNIGTYSDGTEINLQLQFTDSDPDDTIIVRILSGSLPPGTVLTRTGLITGIILPLVGPPGTATPGYDSTPKDTYPNDFTTRSASKNFQFTAEITDGKDSNIRTFEIYVYAKNSETADTTNITADNTFITADATPNRVPVLLNDPGSLGSIRADNYYAYKFDAIDFDGDAIEYLITTGQGIGYDETLYDESNEGFDRGTFGLPPGLQLDSTTGWLYGYIPNQGTTENTYRFAVRVAKQDNPDIVSGFYYFTITTVGNVDTEITWLTDPDLGIINNGAISTLAVEAINNVGGRILEYRLAPGSNSRLPQGLTLQSSGHITGRVSFNTFALDGGSTTFDSATTTFDLQCKFTVNAYSPQTEQLGFAVGSINVVSGGYGFTGQPTITITAPPDTAGAIQATAGVATIVDGVITSIQLGNPGQGYLSAPTITITGGGGVAAEATAIMQQTQITNAVSVFREFTLTINRAFNEPYENLYIKAMPPRADKLILDQLLQNQNVIPDSSLYRPDDPNFGIASNVNYIHAYGLTAATLSDYVESLQLNHYWKNLVLGEIKTAQAVDAAGNVLYEVIYSEIIDNLVNAQGESVSKSVTLPYPVTMADDSVITTVYPNSLINMRNQVIDTVGQISPLLPLWMTSKQANDRVLGFVPAWVIAYVKPGTSGKIRYNIEQQMDAKLNLIDYKVDRYEIDRSQTHNWNSATKTWIPTPPVATTFDHTTCVFDGGSVTFIAPADRWTNTNEYDKYLVFPKTNILG